jgi:hypothetical protein
LFEGRRALLASTEQEANTMSLSFRLASLSTLAAATSLLLGACAPTAIIADDTGGASTGDRLSCVESGGTCEAITPDACANGTLGDTSKYSCGSGGDALCCLPFPRSVECESEGGACKVVTDGACVDGAFADPSEYSCGSTEMLCCLPDPPVTPCATEGGTCQESMPGACADGVVALGGKYSCRAGSGVQCCLPPCTPGQDQTCNSNPEMSALAGTCNADRTCTCNPGYSKVSQGKCS